MPQRGKERGGGGGERRKELPVAGKRKCVGGKGGLDSVDPPRLSFFALPIRRPHRLWRQVGGSRLVYSQGFSARRVAERSGLVFLTSCLS